MTPLIHRIILLFVILSVFSPSAIAVGLSTYDSIIKYADFEPGKEIRYRYFVTQTTGRTMDYSFFKGGDLSQYLSFDPPTIVSSQVGQTPQFDVVLRFPSADEGIPPGMHTLTFGIQEQIPPTVSGGFGLAATTSVQTAIRLRVLFSNKSIEASIYAPSISEGGDLVISAGARSWSKQDIDEAYMSILVIDEAGKVVKSFVTEKQRLPAGQSISFLPIVWSTLGKKPGMYTLQGTLYFDGYETTVGNTVQIGELKVSIGEYTKTVIAGKISEVTVYLSSNWNYPIDNIYYVLESSKAGKSIRSPNFRLDPFGSARVGVYWDATTDIPGDYGITLTAYYQEKTTVKKGVISVLLPESLRHLEQPSPLGWGIMLVIIALLIILIATNAYWLLWTKRRKSKEDDKEKGREQKEEKQQRLDNYEIR